MAGSVHDQAHLAALFDAGEVTRLFSASAELRALLLVEGTLAKVQGSLGTIPEISAAAIHRASLEIQIDPGALAAATAQNGVCIPALVATFRDEMQAPEHAQYIHWGATSQDIIDTGLMLRLRQAAALLREDIKFILRAMGRLAEDHAHTPMMARTYGQHAAPTSFGAVVASWGAPMEHALVELGALKFYASLSGAVGTASALGENPAQTRALFAEALNLTDPMRSWHTDRSPVLAYSAACVAVLTALGTLGENLTAHTQSDVGDIALAQAGSSSTMPQKQNPVGPAALVAMARTGQGLGAVLQGAAMHRFQRDGSAWFTEWMTLPQIVLAAAAACKTAKSLVEGLTPSPDRMLATLTAHEAVFAETLSFELAGRMPRPDAQAAVKRLAAQARETGGSLIALAQAEWPDLPADIFAPEKNLGQAPSEARAFAERIRAL